MQGEVKTKKKWYQQNITIILLLIFFFPVGLILMWMYGDWKKPIKIAVSIVIAFIVVLPGLLPTTIQTIETDEVLESYKKIMTENYSIVNNVEHAEDRVYIIYVNNKWYLYKDEEKKFFGQEAYKILKRLNDDVFSLMIYDENNNLVAKSKLDGTITIKE